jgi:hypothetical protein
MATPRGPHHARDASFHVNFTLDEVDRVAQEISDNTVAPVTLSLFTFWICESRENYETAKSRIRELSLDQVRTRPNLDEKHSAY